MGLEIPAREQVVIGWEVEARGVGWLLDDVVWAGMGMGMVGWDAGFVGSDDVLGGGGGLVDCGGPWVGVGTLGKEVGDSCGLGVLRGGLRWVGGERSVGQVGMWP